MGSRSRTDTLVRVFLAFMRQPTWTQADLARECKVGTATVRRLLQELSEHGVPLELQYEHPHAFWSVPPKWFPGGVLLDGEQVADALRVLPRLPRTKARDRLLRALVGVAPAASSSSVAIVSPPASQLEEQFLPLAEDAASRRIALRLRYHSARHGTVDPRHVSVHRVFPGPPARIVAVCHNEDTLKWFRVERFTGASLDDTEPYRDRPAADIETFVSQSLDGFRAPESAPIECSFFVRDPADRWVEKNLPGRDQMTMDRTVGGTRFTCTTAGLPVLARFVVGLGDAAHAETPELATAVRELAQGALAAHQVPARMERVRERKVSTRAVGAKRRRGW